MMGKGRGKEAIPRRRYEVECEMLDKGGE